MRVLVLYRSNSEHGRLVEEFVHEFQNRHDSDKIELLNVDTREGSATATLYDVVQYPAVMVLQSDGSLQRSWIGETLPLIDEVIAYARG